MQERATRAVRHLFIMHHFALALAIERLLKLGPKPRVPIGRYLSDPRRRARWRDLISERRIRLVSTSTMYPPRTPPSYVVVKYVLQHTPLAVLMLKEYLRARGGAPHQPSTHDFRAHSFTTVLSSTGFRLGFTVYTRGSPFVCSKTT